MRALHVFSRHAFPRGPRGHLVAVVVVPVVVVVVVVVRAFTRQSVFLFFHNGAVDEDQLGGKEQGREGATGKETGEGEVG